MLVVYILLGLLAVLLLLGVGAMIFFKLTIGRRDSWHRPEEKTVGSGEKQALLLYQPSNGRHNVPLAQVLAEQVAKQGYTVTVNYPSEQLTYDPAGYDLLLFGSAVYMGESSKALRNYIQAHPVTGKDILLFVTGQQTEQSPELAALKLLLPDDNRIFAIKLSHKTPEKLVEFAGKHISA